MNENPKIPSPQAKAIARRIMQALQPHCEKFTFAGSLRRMASEVGDIEVVALPTLTTVQDGLFGTREIRSQAFCMAVCSLGENVKGSVNDARYVCVEIPASGNLPNVQFDLFIPQPHDYGRILAIRTGPSSYSSKVLAARWVAMGWCGTKDGLRRQSQCSQKGKTWELNKGLASVQMPPDFLDEKSFFEFLGLDFVEPKDRL